MLALCRPLLPLPWPETKAAHVVAGGGQARDSGKRGRHVAFQILLSCISTWPTPKRIVYHFFGLSETYAHRGKLPPSGQNESVRVDDC